MHTSRLYYRWLIIAFKWAALALAGAVYFYDYFLPIFPEVAIGDLVSKYNINPERMSLVIGVSFALYGSFHFFSFKDLTSSLKQVAGIPLSWLSAAVNFILYTTTVGFTSLWGADLLEKNHQISCEMAWISVSFIYVGWLLGAPFMEYLAKKLGVFRPLILWSALLGTGAIAAIYYIPLLSIPTLITLLFFVGFFCAALFLNFNYIVHQNLRQKVSFSPSCSESVITLGSAILQPLIWMLLNFAYNQGFFSKTCAMGDISSLAISSLPLSFLLVFILSFMLKERPGSLLGSER